MTKNHLCEMSATVPIIPNTKVSHAIVGMYVWVLSIKIIRDSFHVESFR